MFSPGINIFSFARRIGRPLILDGAMGSVLQKSHKRNDSLWMSYLNNENPESVLKLHRAYIKAGADIITTNTFRTNPAALQKFQGGKVIDSKKYVKYALDIAIIAVNNTPVIIAGSNAPAEDCYQKNRYLSHKMLKQNHANHIKYLLKAGAHLILNETQSHYDEIKIIADYCFKNKIPYVISLYFDENLKILSGEPLKHIVEYILKYYPLAIGFNCINPEHFMKFFRSNRMDYNWGIYFNCGAGPVSSENFTCDISPREYIKYVKTIITKSPSFIGACCGSSPEHIKQIRMFFDAKKNN